MLVSNHSNVTLAPLWTCLKGDDRIEFAKAGLSGDKASIVKAFQDAGATGVAHFFHVRRPS